MLVETRVPAGQPPLRSTERATSAAACDVSLPPWPHRSTRRMHGSLLHRHRPAPGIANNLEHAVPPPRPPCPEARDPSRQPIFLKSHTLHFSASFLMARSTVSPTVEVEIPRTSPISR